MATPALRPLARDIAGRLLFGVGITRPSVSARGRLTVATFHRVLPAVHRAEYDMPGLVVTPDELAWFLTFFTGHFTCGPLAEVVQRWRRGEQPSRPFLAITFDDGQADNFEHARPVLERLGVRASFFVPVENVETNEALWHDRLAWAARAARQADPEAAAGLLDEAGISGEPDPGRALVRRSKAATPDRRHDWIRRWEALAGGGTRPAWDAMMNWEQLAILVGQGHEVGSHSMTHPLLPQCDDDQLEHEIATSRSVLAERLGIPVTSFCYPNGDHDARTVAAVRRAGYEQAVTTTWGVNRPQASLLELRRCDMEARHATDRTGRPSIPRLAWRMSGTYPGLR